MTSALEYQEARGRKHAWLRAYIVVFWDYLALRTLYSVLEYFLGLLGVLLTEKLLVFQEKQDAGQPSVEPSAVSAGLRAVAFSILLGVVQIFLGTWYGFYTARMDLRVNAALVGAILERALHRPDHSKTGADTWTVQATGAGAGGGGSIFNLISLDSGPSVSIVLTVLGLWAWPMQVWSAGYLLYQRVQWAFVPGLMMLMALKLLSTFLLSYDGILRNRLLARKDLRTALCSEAFTHVRTLQMLSWLEPFRQRILDAREKELQITQRMLYLEKTNEGIGQVTGVLINLATFAFYSLTYKERLKASQVIAVIGLINALNGPLGAIPGWIQGYLVFRSAYRRVNAFIARSDGGTGGGAAASPDGTSSALRLCAACWSWPAVAGGAAATGGRLPRDDGCAQAPSNMACANAPLLAEGEAFRLGPLDLELNRGEVLIVAGASGAGKSSLLRALLAEMPYLSGDVSCVGHPIPYAEQSPRLFSGSLRENVLFGLPFDSTAYARVLSACDLQQDLAEMPLGDSTELGDGQTVSSGQRSRIALARALYCLVVCERTLLLLDDPLASLDRQTCRNICQRLLGPGGVAAGAAVVICASDPSVFQGFGPRLLTLRGGQCASSGRLEAAADGQPSHAAGEDGNAAPAAAQGAFPLGGAEGTKASERNDEGHGQPARGAGERSRHGQVQLAVYKEYGALVGWFGVFSIIASIVGIMVFQQLCDIWLAFWTDDSPDKRFPLSVSGEGFTGEGWSQVNYLRVYGWLVLFFCAFNFTGFWLEVWGGVVAARRLFKEALHVLWRDVGWWDQQPQGRVLNRFIADVGTVDGCIAVMIGVVSGAILYFVGHTFFLSLTNPICLFLVPPIALAFERVAARYYRRSIREFQRLLLVSTSPLDQSASELVCGQVTIRALRAQRHALLGALDSLDRLRRASFLKSVTGLWLSLRLGLLGYTLTAFNTLYPVMQFYGLVRPQAAGLVGFTMAYSGQLIGIIKQLIGNFSDVEMQLISIERLKEYAQQSVEVAKLGGDLAEPPPPAGWPSAGRLELRAVCVAYGHSPAAPLALREATFEVAAAERVAVLGRTGAGKSTLLKAILKLVPLRSGAVIVDGVPLRDVDDGDRRAVGVVPQTPVVFDGTLRFNLDPKGVESESSLWTALHRVGLAPGLLGSGGGGGGGGAAPAAALGPRIGDGSGLDTWLGTASCEQGCASVELTAGQRQLLGLARAALCGAKVLLLDEVTAGLEHQAALRVVDALRAQLAGRTCLVVTHQAELLALCSRFLYVDRGLCRWGAAPPPAPPLPASFAAAAAPNGGSGAGPL